MPSRLVILLALPALLLAGCTSSDQNIWTVDVCNRMLEVTLKQIDENKATIDKLRVTFEAAQRRGDTADITAHQKSLESYRSSIAGNLRYIDNDLLKNCDRSQLRAELLQQIDPARKLLDDKEQVLQAEGKPDLKITGITSEFVPFEVDEKGACSGPYLNLVFNVTNQGDVFPRPVELKMMEERVQGPRETMLYFAIVAEMDFGSAGKRYPQILIDKSKLAGGVIPSGGFLSVPLKLRVENNQQQARISAKVAGAAFLKVANDKNESVAYESDIDIPIWDIYTESNAALPGIDENGGHTADTKTAIINKGKSPTPGPVEGHFIIRYTEDGPSVASWSGKTEGPISPGGGTDIYNRKTVPVKLKLEDKFLVNSTLIPLCPDGSYGTLSDGNVENNIRILRQ